MCAETFLGGIEFGGTKIVLATGTPDGKICEREVFPTTAPESVLPKIVDWFKARSIQALGVGAFGPTGVNPDLPSYGKILSTPKQGWRNFNLLQALKDGLNVPVGYDTDVNAACLGEAVFGAARGLDNVVYLTVGTGIGAGVLLEGKLQHGMLHPEAGHILVEREANDSWQQTKCPYHQNCLEGLASGPAIQERWGLPAVELTEKDEVWELEAAYLAKALSTYVMCYSPQRIILGGGVMEQKQLFPLIQQKLVAYLNGYINTPEIEDIQNYVVPGGCEGNQGILGALVLGQRALVA
jgi:fructokinase